MLCILMSESSNRKPLFGTLLPTSSLFSMCSVRPTFFAAVIRTDARDDENFLMRVYISEVCESS
jgi:hypothetical protein